MSWEINDIIEKGYPEHVNMAVIKTGELCSISVPPEDGLQARRIQ